MKIEIAIKEENGVIKITLTSPEKPVVIETSEATAPAAVSEDLTTMKREYERVKKAVYRAKKKLEATTASLKQTVTAAAVSCSSPALAGCPSPAINHCPAPVPAVVPCPVPRVPEACPQIVPHVPQTVPGDNWGQGTEEITYRNTSNKKYYNKTMSDKSLNNPISAVANTPVPGTAKTDYDAAYPNNCLPFAPEAMHQFIPLVKLPDLYHKIITAWNNLPLPEKLKGLFMDRAQELYALLKQFGEAAVYKAIRTVAECPFLLGKSANSRGWVISFSWLLKPHNMEKVLADKYRDREKRYQGYDNYSLAYAPWLEEGTDTETCYIDPAVMAEGVTKLSDHTRNCLNHAAKLLGLKQEATA